MARKETLVKIETVLRQRREALTSALAGDDSLLQQMNQPGGGDVIDFASDTAFGELSSQLAEVASRELVSIDLALKQMRAGKYGKCESCNRNIGLPRLQALPYATLCIDCQREIERAGSRSGGNTDWSRILEGTSDEQRLSDLDIRLS